MDTSVGQIGEFIVARDLSIMRYYEDRNTIISRDTINKLYNAIKSIYACIFGL